MADLPKIRIDMEGRRAWRGDRALALPRLQFNLLVYLATNEGQVMTRAKIMRDVWGAKWTGDTKTLDMHVLGLRRLIPDDRKNPHYVTTVRGIGFRMEAGTVEFVSSTRIIIVRPGDVLAIGNCGEVSERAAATASALRDQLRLSEVLLFEGDIDMAALPGSLHG
ncbi:winged helix-turn-helix domain-containing protein [Nonomuraea sp. KM90]|uniref:winged helix-turn-helix domain-containing protein n=1 Tax=Nonomuraea sp. KM90 TaxID=3457428 RepID=UPI003FCE23BA